MKKLNVVLVGILSLFFGAQEAGASVACDIYENFSVLKRNGGEIQPTASVRDDGLSHGIIEHREGKNYAIHYLTASHPIGLTTSVKVYPTWIFSKVDKNGRHAAAYYKWQEKNEARLAEARSRPVSVAYTPASLVIYKKKPEWSEDYWDRIQKRPSTISQNEGTDNGIQAYDSELDVFVVCDGQFSQGNNPTGNLPFIDPMN